MRTKTISRWRKAALATVTAASLAFPVRAQQTPAAAQPAPGENGQIPAANTANPDAGATQEYTIQRGDTLWDLSQKFLANPWYWPKIWSLNPSIENPHWIYPGQKLQIKAGAGGAPGQVEGPAGGQGANDQASAQVAGGENGTAPGDVNAPDAPGTSDLAVAPSQSDAALSAQVVSSAGRLAFKPPATVRVFAPGLVSSQEIDQAGSLDSSFEEKGMIAPYDTAYVRFKQDNVARVGDRLTIFRVEGDINNAKTGAKVATRTKTVGEAKVIAVAGPVLTVQITGEREEIERGDLVRPWVDDSRRLTPRANAREVNGNILNTVIPGIEQIGIGQQVFIDKGKNDGVEEGNTFLVLKQGDGLGTTGSGMLSYTEGDKETSSERRSDPDENVGLLMVIDVRDNMSTAVVVRSIRELEVGDRIQMRAGSGG